MPSFDAVSELDGHEVTNGVDQANRELSQRFDFKGTDADYTRDLKEPFVVIMKAQADFQLKQMLEILKLRLAKRGVDVGCIEVKDPEVNLAEARQKVILKHGIDQDTAKKIVKLLKESGRGEIGDSKIGEVLSAAKREPEQPWPPEAVREVIETAWRT